MVSAHASLFLDCSGRVIRKSGSPTRDLRAGARSRSLRRELLANDMGNAQRECSFRSGAARDPLIGVCAGL